MAWRKHPVGEQAAEPHHAKRHRRKSTHRRKDLGHHHKRRHKRVMKAKASDLKPKKHRVHREKFVEG
jgi:hypothetical protein